jgi:acetyltransferase
MGTIFALSRAALAHTGKLAGSQQVWEAVFRQSGIISVGSFEEIVDCLLAFYWMPQPAGKRVAILSGMGGTNVGTADSCIAMGLEIARFSDDTNEKLGKIIPAVGTAISNPVDLGVGSLMSPDLFGETMKVLAADENVDSLLVITAPDSPRSITSIAEVAKEINKPLAVALFDIPGLVGPHFNFLLKKHIPTYYEPKRAAFALSKLTKYSEFLAEL